MLIFNCDSEYSHSAGGFATDPSYNINVTIGSGDADALQNDWNGALTSLKEYIATNVRPEKVGYSFDGWFYDADRTSDFEIDDFLTAFNATNQGTGNNAVNLVLYAKWIANEYSVTYKKNNGESDVSIPITFGQLVTAPAVPNKVGYTFGGWYTDNNTFANLYNFSGTSISGNLVLYAKWIQNVYTVNFKVGGVIDKTVKLNYNGRVTSYEFGKWPWQKSSLWYADSSFSTSYDFDTSVTSSFDLYLKRSSLSSVRTDTIGSPKGIAYHDGKFYLTSKSTKKLTEFTDRVSSSGTQKITEDYTANSTKSFGVLFHDGYFYIVNTSDKKIYAFNSSFEQDSDKNITLHSDNANPADLTYHDGFFYVVDSTDKKVYVYNVADKTRDSSKEFSVNITDAVGDNPNENPHLVRNPFGITSAGEHFYVAYSYSSYNSRVHAFKKSDNTVDTDGKSFELHTDNDSPEGLLYNDGVFFIPDSTDSKVYFYKK